MTTPPNLPAPVESAITTAIKDAVKVAAAVLVVLGALPALAQAAGIAHIVVPASVLGYATIATTVLTGFVSWAKAKGITSSVVAKVTHSIR